MTTRSTSPVDNACKRSADWMAAASHLLFWTSAFAKRSLLMESRSTIKILNAGPRFWTIFTIFSSLLSVGEFHRLPSWHLEEIACESGEGGCERKISSYCPGPIGPERSRRLAYY